MAPLSVRPNFDEDKLEAQTTTNRTGTNTIYPPDGSLFGFYVQAHKQPKATLEVVKSIKKHMPSAPVYLLSSAGYHFDPLEQRFFNLRFVYDPENVNLPKGTGNLTHWFDRVKAAALWCNCSYLVIMEEDTILRSPLVNQPPYDAGGVQTLGWPWSDELKRKYPAVGNWSHIAYGMCGGSYVRVEAYLDAYAKTNWTRIQAMGEVMKVIGRYNDATLAVVMMDQGYILKPWKDLTEVQSNGQIPDPEAPLLHQFKHFYKQPLTEEDGVVVSDRME
jgi:hypothetical protein